METLNHLRETARRAFNWTSWSPEKRGDRVVAEYSAELDADIETLKSKGADDSNLESYKKKYEELLCKWLRSHSNVASAAIAGPANFPVERNRKRSNWADKHYSNFREWRDKVFTAYDRYEKKAAIAAAGGELEIAKKKLQDLEALQEMMKRINAAHRAYKKNPASIIDNGLSEEEQQKVIQWVPKFGYEKQPYPTYRLTNNLATIKNTRARVAELEKKESNAQGGNKVIPFEGGKVILNFEEDRIQIQHNEKPGPATIDSLKRSGWRWSPFFKCWQRKLTGNSLWAAERLLQIQIKTSEL